MPQPRTFTGDGKKYTFTPGRNGSLVGRNLHPTVPAPMFLSARHDTKVIGPQAGADPLMLAQLPPDGRQRAKVIGPTPEMMAQQHDPLAALRMLLARR